jgi:membrane-associated protein
MHDLPGLIKSVGYLGVWGIIFAESGLFIGFFLPGDSLLFTAGFVASQGFLNIWVLIFGSFVCAVLGDNVGYATGYKFGRRLFEREDSWLFQQKNLVKTQEFYEKHGKQALVLARFTPIIRTFTPIVAGIGAMQYRSFMIYNLIGGLSWTFSLAFLGFFLGKKLPAELVDKYFVLIVGVIIVVSLIPSIWHLLQEKMAKKG